MKYYWYILIFSVLSQPVALTQSTFNKQYYFDGIAAIGNGIHVTDSCYYVSGLVVDTIGGSIYDGLMFGKLNLQGELEEYTLYLDTMYDFENWETPLLSHSEGFTSIGYTRDSLMGVYLMTLNEQGEKDTVYIYRSPFLPDNDFYRPFDAVRDSDGNYYVLAWAGNPVGFSNEDLVLLKVNSSGEEIWSRTYGTDWNDTALALFHRNGHLYIGSERQNTNLTNLNKKFYSQIRKLDSSGDVIWTWTSQSDTQQGANDIIVEDDGSIIAASGRGFLEQVNIGHSVMLWDRGLIFKMSADREIEWECEFTEPLSTLFNRLGKIVKAPQANGYVAAGEFITWVSEDEASWLGWLVKVSMEGDSLWSRKLFYYELSDSIEYEHTIHDLKATPDGGYFMSGYTIDREVIIGAPIQRAWFIKVDSEGCLIPGCGLVDAEEPNEQGPHLLLYPNPAAEHLNIYLGDSGGQQWTFLLFDAAGQQLSSYAAPTSHTTYMLPVDNYPAGSYYLQVADKLGRRLKTYPWIKGE